MAEAIIDIHQLTKSYGRTQVLRGVNLQVPRGAIVGLMGTNGAGKSTLIKCLLGLLAPMRGRPACSAAIAGISRRPRKNAWAMCRKWSTCTAG